ncbi:MAG TPA: TIGR03668 family PPOX class F420-dependent oxidoreductase [Jiangellaceae bacterium]|nr:TIGR03668 family PPOX class F420-dependent oxidoreductase [Jiangellaceae bacterium]
MRLDEGECRKRFAVARIARLATTGNDHQPHLVPVTFALTGDRITTAVDQKPKSTTNLRRLHNIAANPRVSLLVDHYTDDWSKLWWVRADGTASVHTDDTRRHAVIRALAAKYAQYRDDPPQGPVIEILIHTWRGWAS